jgi:hypothetical protein
MDPATESRLVATSPESPMVYIEALGFFMGANFLFHHKVFRHVGSRPQFLAFMIVNSFASYQMAQCFNTTSLARYAAILENTKEIEHRARMNEVLRRRMFITKAL